MKVKRLLFSVVLSTALALFVVPQTLEVKAATTAATVTAVEKQRIGNTSVYWEIKEDGTLVVSGEGDPHISNLAASYVPWYEYRHSIKRVTIERGVTPKSMSYWFYGCTSLVNAPVIPEGVENCEDMFRNCTSLVNAPAIPKGVKNCSYMFYNCTSLESGANLPTTVTKCTLMYSGCKSLKKVPRISCDSTSYYGMFYNCTSLTGEVFVPSNAKECDLMFYGCKALRLVPFIPDGVESCRSMFEGCGVVWFIDRHLTDFMQFFPIPSSVKNTKEMFKDCTKLTGTVCFEGPVDQYEQMFLNAGTSSDPIKVMYKDPSLRDLVDEIVKTGTNLQICVEEPSEEPSETPSIEPIETPSIEPSEAPIETPIETPSETPSEEPSEEPSEAPSEAPSVKPSVAPIETPSIEPSEAPIETPSETPSVKPSEAPSEAPSVAPSVKPSEAPSVKPSVKPSVAPVKNPGQVKNVKVTQKKKGVKPTVTFAKVSNVKGYQIQYSSNSKFSKSTSVCTTNTKVTLSKTVKGKKYFVRVRAWKYGSNNKKLYGKWSSIKSITVK